MASTDNQTIIGPGATFRGELTLSGAAKVLGTFEGSITAQGQVEVGQGANCNATVDADTIVVDGAVKGDLIARQKLQLTSKANVEGDINAAAFIVAEGATFVGRCCVGPDAPGQARAAKTTTAVEPKATETRSGRNSSKGETVQAGAGNDWLNGSGTGKAAWLSGSGEA